MTQVLQGTWQELAIHAAVLGDKQLTLVIPGEEEAKNEPKPRQPEVVKTKERLEELLLQGLASPGREMTDADWDAMIERAEQRAKGKQE
jgi:hypothetical protein